MTFGGSTHVPFTMQHRLEQPGTTLNSGVPSLGNKQNTGLCVQHSGLPRNSCLSCLTWSTRVWKPLKRDASSTLELHYHSRHQLQRAIRTGLRYQNLWLSLSLKLFPAWSQHAKTERGDCFLKCPNFSKRLQGIQRNGKTWPNQRNKTKLQKRTLKECIFISCLTKNLKQVS